MTFGVQEGVSLNLLDTKFHLFPVQNGRMMSEAFDHNIFAKKGPFSKIRSHIHTSMRVLLQMFA